ncbi:BTB/POZ domain-containing protein 2 [Aphelenchoides bicaudatus]|nr:BTB/POZ domain-containing protein 2 [Aphelenchoides bicaudatus]
MDMKVFMDNLAKKEKDSGDSSQTESIDEPDEMDRPAPLTKRLNEFRAIDLGCDVTFLVGDKQKPIHAHKLILACSSDVFKAMFYGLLSEFPHRYANFDHTPVNNKSKHLDLDGNETANDIESNSLGSSSVNSSVSSLSPESGHSVADAEEEYEEEENKIHTVHVVPPTKTRYAATELSLYADRRYPSPIEVVRVPDIAPSAFKKMIDFIYNDFDSKNVHLNENNVMEVLYAAKKYAIDQLVSECVRFLLKGLTASNAVCLLGQARLFHENTLIDRCFEMIDRNTDLSLQPQNVEETDHDTLLELLSRTQLDPSSELVIFNAALSWAKAECERQKIDASIANMREQLGVALKLIRFPRMTVQEFGIVASSSLLTCEEIAEVFMHLTIRPAPAVRYPSGFRCSSRSKHIASRFSSVSSKRYGKRENRVCFTADKDIQLFGLGIYGLNTVKPHTDEDNSAWQCQVEIQLATINNDLSSSYTSPLCVVASNTVFLQGILGDETPLLATFEKPVACRANESYSASMRFVCENAIQTVSGKDGKDHVVVELPFDQKINFKFLSYRHPYGDDGCKSEGQIPSLHFYVQWPDKTAASTPQPPQLNSPTTQL